MRKRWWSLVDGKGKGIPYWGHSTGKGLWVTAMTTGGEQSEQAAARPCSEGRDLAPDHEDIVFPSDCLG